MEPISDGVWNRVVFSGCRDRYRKLIGRSLTGVKRNGLVIVFFLDLLIFVTSVVGLACRIMTQVQITNDESWQRANITITTYVSLLHENLQLNKNLL